MKFHDTFLCFISISVSFALFVCSFWYQSTPSFNAEHPTCTSLAQILHISLETVTQNRILFHYSNQTWIRQSNHNEIAVATLIRSNDLEELIDVSNPSLTQWIIRMLGYFPNVGKHWYYFNLKTWVNVYSSELYFVGISWSVLFNVSYTS